MIFAGAGVGLFVQVALLGGQNAAEYRDLGAATGALNFFKSIGGGVTTAAYQAVFEWTAPFMVLALALLMPEKPLSEEMVQVAEGKVEAPEY